MKFEINWDESVARDDEDRPLYVPGAIIKGRVSWWSDEPLEDVNVSLLFESKGKATPQREIRETISCTEKGVRGDVAFAFTAADWPWSFSGKLTSVVWMVQARASEPDVQKEWPVVISPSGSEIDLYAYPMDGDPPGRGWRRMQAFKSLKRRRNSS